MASTIPPLSRMPIDPGKVAGSKNVPVCLIIPHLGGRGRERFEPLNSGRVDRGHAVISHYFPKTSQGGGGVWGRRIGRLLWRDRLQRMAGHGKASPFAAAASAAWMVLRLSINLTYDLFQGKNSGKFNSRSSRGKRLRKYETPRNQSDTLGGIAQRKRTRV
jgi:hypothetical protein